MVALLIIVLSSCQAGKPADLSQNSSKIELSQKEEGNFASIESQDQSSYSKVIDEEAPAESDIEFEYFSDVHTITQSIADGGIPLTFRFTNNYEAPIGIEDKFAFAIATEYHIVLDILNQTGVLIQSIPFEAFCQYGLGYYQETTFKNCIIDINFDGYLDILILGSVGGAKANHYYLGWIYNPQTNQFDEINIGSITNLAIDKQNKVLKSVVADTAASHTYSIYRYVDDEFILTNSLNVEYESKNYYYTETELINGEMVVVSHLMDLPENADELASRYGEDTIFEYDSFFDSDYGAATN